MNSENTDLFRRSKEYKIETEGKEEFKKIFMNNIAWISNIICINNENSD